MLINTIIQVGTKTKAQIKEKARISNLKFLITAKIVRIRIITNSSRNRHSAAVVAIRLHILKPSK